MTRAGHRDPEIRARNAEIVSRLKRAEEGEQLALIHELVLNNLEVARSIARRYATGTSFSADVEQTANLALVTAARDFDVARGCEFLAYAVPCITGAVKHYFRDYAWMVRPPRSVQNAHMKTQEDRTLHAVSGVAVETCFRPRSLDQPLSSDGPSLAATMAFPDDSTWERAEARLLLAPHLRKLSPRARQVLHLRFVEDRTQEEIGEILGVTQFHVSRLLRRYLSELRDAIPAN